MNTPYDRPQATFDPTEWAAYEKAGRAARIQYRTLPISLNHVGDAQPCTKCRRRTQSFSGVCRTCQKAKR